MPGWETDDYQAVAEFLARGVQQVADAGADFYICPDNTAHIVLERIAAGLPRASVYVFQRELGEALGLDVASGERMRIATAPMPARLKEWAYAGFAITHASALIAHLEVGDRPEARGFAAGTGVLWGLSYFCWRRL